MSRDKEGIERLLTEGQIIKKPEDLFKTKVIDHLQEFLLELGRWFTFIGRQVRFTFEDENPTIGILLCKNKNDAVVEMTLSEDNNQIFASKYLTILPRKRN